MQDFALSRRAMVDCQVRTFDVHDLPVLAAMEAVPRERFVSPGRESLAYLDQDTPVFDGIAGAERRFMLKPMVIGRLLQGLEVERGEKALDVACGLGYASAILARLGCAVVGLEFEPGRRGRGAGSPRFAWRRRRDHGVRSARRRLPARRAL